MNQLLVDAQLPILLCTIFEDLGVKAKHVREFENGLYMTDAAIAEYADAHDLFVVTKDADFFNSHFANGTPARLFLITLGNTKNRMLFDTIRNNILLIKVALEKSVYLELNQSGLIQRKA